MAAAALAISWGIFHADVLGANVTATWTYDYTPEPACSGTRFTRCIDHFEVEDITDQKNVGLIKKVSNPARAVGRVDGISIAFRYGPPFGQRTISVIAVERNSKGDRITSDPLAARVTVTIRPGVKVSLMF